MQNCQSEEWYKWARENYDEVQIEAEIAAIPLNINRAGKLYKKKLKEIYGRRNISF